MTIGFSTTWPDRMGGGPTHFVEKIWAGLPIPKYREIGEHYGIDLARCINMRPKLHTIREDPHDRWKVGMKIHPVINNRTPDRFQFAPTMECKSTQKIEIKHKFGNVEVYSRSAYDGAVVVKVDRRMLEYGEIRRLALNDGFDSVEQFFQWFNKDFTGKIIHWTNLKY